MKNRIKAPEGWSRATINEAPVALSPWRTFRFGRDLVMTPAAETWAPDRVSTKGMKEENVETLMLLNLGRLFPHGHLALGNKSLRDWAGADIEATDPAGCRHLFEVKYGAPAKHVVDQALSYALDTLRSIAEPSPHFHQQAPEDQERFVACRIAGFWTDTRADKWKRTGTLPPAERDWEALKGVLREKPVGTLSFDDCRGAAALHLAGPLPVAIPRRPTHVQFHLVVPDPRRISAEQLFALGRLKWRGHRARIWQVAAEKTSSGTGGRFTFREVWLPPTDTSKATWSFPDGMGPAPVSMDEVLAAVALADPATFRQTSVVSYARGERATFGHSWHGATPSLALSADAAGVKAEAWVINPKSLPAVHGQERAREIKHLRCKTVCQWLISAAPPTDPADTEHVRRMRKKRLDWRTADPVTGATLRARHSSGLAVGSIGIESTDLSILGPAIARLMRQLIETAALNESAFGRAAVTL